VPRRGATEAMTRVAYDRLRERIIRGDYLPGQHLPAAEIAADLQMSRTPVREAMFALEGEHLVVGSLNRGWTVRPLSREMISKLYDLRADLESFAARKAAENIATVPAEHTARLWDAISRLDELLVSKRAEQPGPIAVMMDVNTLIHETIVQASAYPHLSELISQTIDRGVIYRAFDLFSLQQLQRANQFHRMIAEQIVSGEADRAASLMAEHVFQSRDVVLERIDAADGDVSALFARGARAVSARGTPADASRRMP
jgi:DNA-binding GntR family transcriptional regulator